MLAACTRPLTAVALASTAAVPRKPLREIMGILLVQRAPASPADTARGFARSCLLPDRPPPATAALRSTVASQKSRDTRAADRPPRRYQEEPAGLTMLGVA